MNSNQKYKVSYTNNQLIVSDTKGKYKIDLEERLLQFSVKTLKFLMKFPVRKELDVIKYQLSKSATSIGNLPIFKEPLFYLRFQKLLFPELYYLFALDNSK